MDSGPNRVTTLISLAYSVDADDAFMFHALAGGQVAAPDLVFSHRRADTAELNRLALAGATDVVAISAGVYPRVADRYQLLPHGASVGRGFGPVVVAPRAYAPADLAGRRVGIPGLTTTAWMVLRLIEPRAIPVEIPIVPGILPITNVAQTRRFAAQVGASVPTGIDTMFEGLDDDPATRELVAASVAAEQCADLATHGVRHVHFYTLNRAALSYAVCRLLGIYPKAA